MTMDNIDVFSNDNFSHNFRKEDHIGETGLIRCQSVQWHMVRLHSIRQISHSNTLISVDTSHNYYFVASF